MGVRYYYFERVVFLNNTGEKRCRRFDIKRGENIDNGMMSEDKKRSIQLAYYYFLVLGDTLCHQVTEAHHFNT